MKGEFICPSCGYIGKPKTVVRGSFLMEVVLWLFFLVPGLIYSIWRLTGKEKVCPSCGQKGMIPLDSPRGQKLQKELLGE